MLLLRKSLSSESDKVDKIAEEMFTEVTGKLLKELLASLVQDRTAMKVAQQLGVETVSCGAYQGDEVGSSVVGDSTHGKDEIP